MKKVINKYNTLSVRLRATIWFFVCSILQRGISVITTPIFTRMLTTTEYGQFTVFNSWLSIISVVITLNLTAGVYTMGIVKFKEEEKIYTSSLQGLNFILCIFWTIIYLCFRNYWNRVFSLTTVQMLAMFLMIWSSASFGFWMTTQRNAYRYRALVVVTLIVSIMKPVIGIWFVMKAQDKVTARILGLALVEVIGYSGFFFLQMIRGRKFYSGKYWKYAILFNLPLVPHYLSNTVLSGADRIMIEKMVGESEAGIYGLAYSISTVIYMVNDALNKTMSPWLYQKIREKDYASMHKVVYPSLIMVATANICLIAVAPELIAVFAPKEYYEAIYIIPPVAMSGFMTYLYLCFAPFEFYYEKRIWTTMGTLVSAVTNLILNYMFIPIFGYQAAGYITLICYALYALAHYFFMRKVCRNYIEDIRPYSAKVLLSISMLFVAVGLLYIPTYQKIYLRYAMTLMLLAVLFVMRNKWLPYIKAMLKK